MQELNKTVRIKKKREKRDDSFNLIVTIFDGTAKPRSLLLNNFPTRTITFGRSESNDIVLNSRLVSRIHGRFCFEDGHWIIQDKAVFGDGSSENGLTFNNRLIRSKVLYDGDFIRIDDDVESVRDGVLMVFAALESANKWKSFELNRNEIIIGRDVSCDITLSHVGVSKRHARITRENGKYYIEDCGSTNGVMVNNRQLREKRQLHEKDVIIITTSKLIFTSSAISYCTYKSGISVDTSDVVIIRGKGKKQNVTGNHITMNIRPGELVAIVGGSGAGKSTILNCMCGYLPPASGDVYINGVNLYQNFESLKKTIGYVPQSDIVYDNLTLHDMLEYTAKLRLPKDTTPGEREAAIARAIDLVDLIDKSDSFIKKLSGGQRKRASIAVELLSDPNLLFLDEPASGLDPGTERSLMQSLRQMADSGKTIILVTHSTLQLALCDKVAFMGKGGNLCFFGSLDNALRFFDVDDVVDIYPLLNDHAAEWRDKYDSISHNYGRLRGSKSEKNSKKNKTGFQLPILCSRYIRLVINDRQRLLLLLVQAPVLALLISLVADGQQFEQYEMTKGLLFALSCSAFWVGMLNAIQEVCKERSILKREYMTGLSLNSYILSKILVLGILCVIQSALIVGVFALSVGLPEEGIIMAPILELFLTTLLTSISATAMGLFVSSLFNNADRAMTVAPILLMPQILFSGLIFKLDGATEYISWAAICRWSMEGYGTSANLNDLPLKLQQEGLSIPHDAEKFFEFTTSHMTASWGILAAFVILFIILARVVLNSISSKNS